MAFLSSSSSLPTSPFPNSAPSLSSLLDPTRSPSTLLLLTSNPPPPPSSVALLTGPPSSPKSKPSSTTSCPYTSIQITPFFLTKDAPTIMCNISYELFGLVDYYVALTTTCALEMVYAVSLVHDDLPCMDFALPHRGLPFNHALFGIDILVGDALFPVSFQHIISHTPPSLVSLTNLVCIIIDIAHTVVHWYGHKPVHRPLKMTPM